MSAVGFNPAPVNELEELRKAYGSLNDVTRNLADAVKCINRQDLKLAEAALALFERQLPSSAVYRERRAEFHKVSYLILRFR